MPAEPVIRAQRAAGGEAGAGPARGRPGRTSRSWENPSGSCIHRGGFGLVVCRRRVVLTIEQLAQLLARVAFHKTLEGLARAGAVHKVRAEHSLEHARGVGGGHVTVNLAADLLPVAVAASDVNVVALDHVVTDGNLRAEQADVADVVLGARV